MTAKPSIIVRCLLILSIAFLTSVANAQQKSNYSLLWKISGKGMAKPSYLFGTMHLKDPRIFHFSDSVMLALKNCQRFALEVHPDTIIAQMFKLFQNEDTSKSLRKMLSKQEYEKLAKKFKEKNGYELKENSNPASVESLMERDNDKSTDNATFIDGYLYGIARTLNKAIYGLEDATTHLDEYFGNDALKEHIQDIIDDDDFEQERTESEEEMIKIYSAGNLDKIYQYVTDHEMADSVIIARNKVMVASMINYMNDQPLFTAVGAAHLPGPDGVIELLRKQGYTVTRVGATFTGVANTFHIDYSKMKWAQYRDENSGYAISYPGSPIKTNMFELENVVYTDLATGLFYGSYATLRNTIKPGSSTEIINNYINSIKKNNNQLLSKKSVLIAGLPGVEISIKNKSGYLVTQMLATDNELYVMYVESKQLNRLTGNNVSRFFKSYSHFPKIQKAPPTWIDFNCTDGAFSVKMPQQPKDITREVPSVIGKRDVVFKLYMYIAVDSTKARYYLVRYNDYPSGTYLNNEQALFGELQKQITNNGKILREPFKISKDGVEGREMDAILSDGTLATIQTYVKGNRTYMLLSGHQTDDTNEGGDVFLESFKFLPEQEPDYYTFQPDSGRYHLKMPAKPVLMSNDTTGYESYLNNTKTWYATDPRSGASYGIEHATLSPYLRIKDVDSLYRELTKLITVSGDSILKTDTVALNNVKGRDILSQSRYSGKKSRWLLFINNRDVFWLISKLDSSQLYNKTSNTFYRSLVIDKDDPHKIDLPSSKISKILTDVNSADSLTYKKAAGALFFYKPDKDELSVVYEALQKDYKDDTLKTGVRQQLLSAIKKTNNDSTVNLLVKLYHKTHRKDDIQAIILNDIYTIDKKDGYQTYFELLKSDPPLHTKYTYYVFSPLEDSAAFAVKHFDEMLAFLKIDNFRLSILTAIKNIATTKNAEYDQLLQKNFPAITANFKTDESNYLALSKDSVYNKWGGYLYYYFQIMNLVQSKATVNVLTESYLNKDPKGVYVTDAMISRINNRLPVNQVILTKYLDSLGSRYSFMEAYNNVNELDRVPLKYRAVSEFARLSLYQKLVTSDDDNSPGDIKLLGSILKNGLVYYAFKFNNSGSDESLLGITGPYKAGSTKLNFKQFYAYTEYEKLKPNWRMQAEKLIPALIKAYKDTK